MPKQPINDLTAEYVRSILNYDPETGVLTWKVSLGQRARAGSAAGSASAIGYRDLGICGRSYRAHRIAWLITHGRWPDDQIDHINGVRDDNRLCNLREATNAENVQNRKCAHSSSKTGALGVHQFYGKYVAQIRISGKVHHLGLFATIAEAAEVYRQAKREAHPFWHEAPMPKAEHSRL